MMQVLRPLQAWTLDCTEQDRRFLIPMLWPFALYPRLGVEARSRLASIAVQAKRAITNLKSKLGDLNNAIPSFSD